MTGDFAALLGSLLSAALPSGQRLPHNGYLGVRSSTEWTAVAPLVAHTIAEEPAEEDGSGRKKKLPFLD